jgi:hypothetical protein
MLKHIWEFKAPEKMENAPYVEQEIISVGV